MSPEREAFLKQFCLFVRLFSAALGLRCCEQAFSGCDKCRARASHCSGFSRFGAQALGASASMVAGHGLSSRGARA